jgi:hypothetical protein
LVGELLIIIMKIAKSRLKQIIKEELQSVLKERRKKPGWEYDAGLTGKFVNKRAGVELALVDRATTWEEKVRHMYYAMINLNDKHGAGIFPRIQAAFNRAQKAINDLDDRIYELEQGKSASGGAGAKGTCTPEQFKEEFRKARVAGKKNFTFCGKQYSADLK